MFKSALGSEIDFLESLEMVARCEGVTDFNAPRVAQLTQRTNQFNLRTRRYTEAQIAEIRNNSNYVPFSFYLKDRFGEYGLVALVILQKSSGENLLSLFIDTWLMSCRVFKRTLENFVLNSIMEWAGSNGYSQLWGEYLPTTKNSIVKDHFRQLGFREVQNKWCLDIKDFIEAKTFVKWDDDGKLKGTSGRN
jgi:FkbH-like protein